MGRREVSRPYRVWFFAEGERFLFFWRCHRPRWGGRRRWCGVADSSLSLKSQTKGTVLLVCICQRHTKRTVPLVCGLCAIVYCKNNQGCGLISTALILYDFIGIICGAWWRCVLRRSVCCARLRHGVPNCHACHVADGVKPCRLRSRCADDPSCSQPFAAIAIAG